MGLDANAVRKVVIDPDREPIGMIFRLALRGRRTGPITTAMNAGWVPPARKGVSGDYWWATRVRRASQPTLRRPLVVKGETVARDQWPAYITERQHRKILELITQRMQWSPPRQNETYLLSGLVRCGSCGAPLHATTRRPRRDGSPARRYICRNHDPSRQDGFCRMQTLDAEKIEALFASALPTLLLDGSDQVDADARLQIGAAGGDWTDSPERQRLVEAVLAGEDERINHAIERLVDRMSPEATMIRRAASSQRACPPTAG